VTRTGLIAALVMGTALAACADRPVANGKNSNQAPQIGTVPMAPTANGAVRVSGGAVPSSATAATLSPGSERPKAIAAPAASAPPVPAVVAAPPPVVSQTPPPPAPAVEAQPLAAPVVAAPAPVAPAPAPVAVAPAAPPPMERATVGQTLSATALPPAAIAPALPPPPPPPALPVASAPVPVASGSVITLPVDGVTALPPPPTSTLPAVVLPPAAASAPIVAQGVSAPQPPLPPVLVAVSPTALPGKDLAEQLASFAAKAQPGAVAQVNEPGQATPILLRLDREYFAASGRACREISGRTSAADVTYVVCQQETGWALVPALMRSRPLAAN